MFSGQSFSSVHRKVPLRNFRHSSTKIFHGKMLYSHSANVIQKVFRYQKCPETQTGSPRRFSTQRDKKSSTENCETTPLLSINFFDTISFLKHRRVPQEFFRYRETTKYRRSIEIPHSRFLCIKSFGSRNILKNLSFPVRYCQHSETPHPRYPKCFRYQKFFETQKGSATKFFGTKKKKNFDAEA